MEFLIIDALFQFILPASLLAAFPAAIVDDIDIIDIVAGMARII